MFLQDFQFYFRMGELEERKYFPFTIKVVNVISEGIIYWQLKETYKKYTVLKK